MANRGFVKWYKDLLLKYNIPAFQKMQEVEDELRSGETDEQEDQPEKN